MENNLKSKGTKYSVNIHAGKLYDAILDKGYANTAEMSRELGFGNQYLSNCFTKGVMSMASLKHICLLIDREENAFLADEPDPFYVGKSRRATTEPKVEPNVLEVVNRLNTVSEQNEKILKMLALLAKEFGCEHQANEILQ